MKTMKTYILKAVFIAIAVTAFQSCDDPIDLEPISDIGTDRFYQNTEQVNLAVVGIYSSLQLKQLDEWIVTEMRSDNTQLSDRNSENANIPYRQLDRFVSNPLNEFTASYWRASYKTIGLSNNVLENLAVVTDPDLAIQYEAEARFLRGYSLFNLVRLYGGIFVITETVTPQEARNLERKSIEEAYAVILEDLEFAYANLPANFTGNQIGRATKWAAGVELGKALLSQRDASSNTRAEVVLRDVATQSGGRLLPNYSDVFSANNEYNEEIFFAVRYQSGLVGLGSPFPNLFAPVQSGNAVVFGNGRSFNSPTRGMVDIYESNDPRRDINLATQYIKTNGDIETADIFITKYNSTFSNEFDSPNDWVISRYADAILLLAEAINENNGAPTGEAIGYLNAVRNRAGQGDIPASQVGSFFDFKLALEVERRKEFAFENQRWFDLLRTNRAVVVMNNHFATDPQYNDPTAPFFSTPPIQEFQTLLPIPQYEIDLNPSVAQNIGY